MGFNADQRRNTLNTHIFPGSDISAIQRQAGIDAILVRVDEGARGDSVGDDRLDRPLLQVGQHMQDYLAATLDKAEDRRHVRRAAPDNDPFLKRFK